MGTQKTSASWFLLVSPHLHLRPLSARAEGLAARGEQVLQVDRQLSGLPAWLGIGKPADGSRRSACPASASPARPKPRGWGRPLSEGASLEGELPVLWPCVGGNLQHALLGSPWGRRGLASLWSLCPVGSRPGSVGS